MKSTSVWVKNYQSVVDNGRTHGLVIDLPQGKGGDDKGATALELAVMGLAGCISTIYAVGARKMKLALGELSVEIDADKPENEPTITSVKGEVKIRSAESEDNLQKCLDRTMGMCPVGKLYEKASIPIEMKLTLL